MLRGGWHLGKLARMPGVPGVPGVALAAKPERCSDPQHKPSKVLPVLRDSARPPCYLTAYHGPPGDHSRDIPPIRWLPRTSKLSTNSGLRKLVASTPIFCFGKSIATVESQPPMESSSGQLDTRQQRIHERLNRLVGPGSAGFFEDACRIMDASPPFETQTHLVAHCLREIENAMRSVMTTVSDYEEAENPSESKKHKANVEAILDAFGEPEGGALREQWLALLDRGLHKYAHRRSLRPARPVDLKYRSFWEDAQQILDEALSRFEKEFAAITEQLDHLLEIEQPTKNDAKVVAEGVPFSPVAHRYFFERLENPQQWIPMLRKKGLFSTPPSAQRNSETGGISFPSWPASRFLKRIAGKAPSEVSDVLARIPETDNQLVHSDLASAAADLPPSLAAGWAKKEIQWLEEQDRLYFIPDNHSTLITRLAGGGKTDTALRMTRTLLNVQNGEKNE